MYNVYMQNNWHDDAEWFLLGTTGETRFEFQLAINTIIDNPCFKVTALYGGMESEPSNTACLEFDDGGDHVSAPYDLTAEFEPMPLGGIVYLNWYHGNANTDPSQSTTHFNVYVYYGWDDLEWDLVAETTTPHFEYMLGDFWWPEELCFKVTAVQNGNESEPSNIACAWDEPHPDPECEDLSDFHFGDCEMIIGIGYNGNECTWFSGCGTIDQFGNDHANSFFESVEECEATCDLAGGDDCDPDLECAHVVTCIDGLLYPTSCGPGNCDEPIDECDDGGDDGPPECLLDCPGIGDVNPEEDADATCQWIIEIVQPNSQCISDCDEETYGFLMELSGICEQCLNGAFDCADIFEDEEEENGVLYGNVEYVWGDAIELVANAHIRAERIGEDGVTIDVFETSTNEMGQYEISLPAGAYLVTASAYEDSETHDVYIEPMSENQLNFQLGEFYYPDIYALSGQVSGTESANGESYPLAGAQIRAVCLSSGDVFETTSGEEGYYWLHVAFPDLYEVTVTKDGYESFTQTFEIFGIIEANFMLYNGGGTDAEAFLSLGNSIGNQDGFTVPLFLLSNQPVGGLQFAVYPLNESWDYYFIPGELEVLDPCFSGDANDVYGQLWGIMFSLEGCAYEPGETHHVANLSFTVEGSVPAGTELPLTFNYTLVSDPDANEIPSAGEGSVVTFGQPGDVNGDGDVNVVDIVNMVNFALQVEEPTDYEFSAADLNNDGDINILDIVNVVNIILYGDDLQRFDTGDAEVYYKDKTIHIQGEHVAGFQIEFVDVVGVDGIQIPEGWTVNTHGNTIVAYNFDGDLLNGRSIIELNETSEISDVIIADAQGNMILAHVEALPQWVALKDNYPNPFNPQTTISYTLSHDAMVELSVYNLSGRMVESLVNGQQYPGEFSVSWTANGLPSGMYIARLIVDGESFTKKMMLMK